MLRFVCVCLFDCQMTRRFVMDSSPASPLLPLVSSTRLSRSMRNSPLRRSSRDGFTSNLMSRSCHTEFGPSLPLEGIVSAETRRHPPRRRAVCGTVRRGR